MRNEKINDGHILFEIYKCDLYCVETTKKLVSKLLNYFPKNCLITLSISWAILLLQATIS